MREASVQCTLIFSSPCLSVRKLRHPAVPCPGPHSWKPSGFQTCALRPSSVPGGSCLLRVWQGGSALVDGISSSILVTGAGGVGQGRAWAGFPRAQFSSSNGHRMPQSAGTKVELLKVT